MSPTREQQQRSKRRAPARRARRAGRVVVERERGAEGAGDRAAAFHEQPLDAVGGAAGDLGG
jgi:hypothetical protein